MTFFEDIFKFRKKEKGQGLKSGEQRGWGTQNFYGGEGNVTWGVIMMEYPFVCNLWSHANKPFSEPFKDVFIKKNLVNSLSWRNKFWVENSLSVKKNQHCLITFLWHLLYIVFVFKWGNEWITALTSSYWPQNNELFFLFYFLRIQMENTTVAYYNLIFHRFTNGHRMVGGK